MPRHFASRLSPIVARFLPKTSWADAAFAVAHYMARHRRLPRIRDPRRFNEHLLGLKVGGALSDPLRQYLSDKEYMKHYVSMVVGPEYVVETYQVLRNVDDIANLALEHFPCVVKPTHLSGQVQICTKREDAVDSRVMKRWLRTNYYTHSREANYRHLQPKIIVERFLSHNSATPANDYKVFCFHGEPRLVQVDGDRFTNHTRNFYDVDWTRLQVSMNYPCRTADDPKPTRLQDMLDIARALSKLLPSIRVDMYALESELKVGELTNCHESAGSIIKPKVADLWLGELFQPDRRDEHGKLPSGLYLPPDR